MSWTRKGLTIAGEVVYERDDGARIYLARISREEVRAEVWVPDAGRCLAVATGRTETEAALRALEASDASER